LKTSCPVKRKSRRNRNRTANIIYPDVCIVIALNALISRPADEKEIIGNDVNYPAAYIVLAARRRQQKRTIISIGI